MTPAIWQAIHETGAIANLSDEVRLRLTGPDAVRYLNGQVTNDVRRIPPGGALPACVTNHKGKLEAWVHLSQDSTGALFISGTGELRDFLPLRLEKYLIADDCVLEDLTETTALCHVIGPSDQITPLLSAEERSASTPRFGLPGHDLWTTPERLAFWLAHFPILSPEDQSTLEVIQGVPAWGHELTPDLLPPEAGLDLTAIDYHKGCYIGQEVISRIRSVGRVNRHLTALVQTGGPPAVAGWTLHSEAGDPTAPPAGTLTRTALHPLTGQRHALAFLRRGTTPPWHGGPDPSAAAAVLTIRKSLDD